MPTHRCRAPACGRFVSAAGDSCTKHAVPAANTLLDPEIRAIRKVLEETLAEIDDPETRAKLVPRIVSVSIQAIKADRQMGSQASSELLSLLEKAEREMEKDRHPERSEGLNAKRS